MDNLQDATRLIRELTTKLAELDSRVAAYRLEMASEFTRFSEELLKNVPEDVAYRVSQAIADSVANYPHLYPPGSLNSSRSVTPTNLADIPWHGKGSPPPILPHTSGTPTESHHDRLRSSHEREQEFTGLFVPGFLPLLDSAEPSAHSPPSSSGTAKPIGIDDRLTVGITKSSDRTLQRHRPSPLRRTTDTSVDSVASDSSSAKVRKSALRRSSGSSKADSPRDPRRVRFDFQGQEVLPSSSPQVSQTALAEKGGPGAVGPLAADDSYGHQSLGDIQGEEDFEDEPPRKVSSSQALRALSKAPLDEGTVWTVVNPEMESENSSEADKSRKMTGNLISTSRTSTEHGSATVQKLSKRLQVEVRDQAQAKTNDDTRDEEASVAQDDSEEEEDDFDGSDEEPALFMVSKRGFKKKLKTAPSMSHQVSSSVSAQPTSLRSSKPQPATYSSTPVFTMPRHTDASVSVNKNLGAMNEASKSSRKQVKPHDPRHVAFENESTDPKIQIKATGKVEDDSDEDDLFAFDNEDTKLGGEMPTVFSRPKKYLPETQQKTEEDDQPNMNDETYQTTSGLPSSPPIAMSVRPRPENQVPAKIPPRPESKRQPSTSIGSLNKRSLTSGPVKDPELLKEVSEVEVPFFVGSVNGRSGPDASNVKSYQASLLSPTQMSGSFAERLMWEKSQGVTYDSDADDGKKDDDNGRR